MFYDYNKRMSNLENIYKIASEEEKYVALQRFIVEEKLILSALKQSTFRSQALNSAQTAVRGYEEKISEAFSLD